MDQGRYNFNTIFSVYPALGIIIPHYTVVINNMRFPQGHAINRNTSFGGLNLFSYIGHELAGTWNTRTRELTILGFY